MVHSHSHTHSFTARPIISTDSTPRRENGGNDQQRRASPVDSLSNSPAAERRTSSDMMVQHDSDSNSSDNRTLNVDSKSNSPVSDTMRPSPQIVAKRAVPNRSKYTIDELLKSSKDVEHMADDSRGGSSPNEGKEEPTSVFRPFQVSHVMMIVREMIFPC